MATDYINNLPLKSASRFGRIVKSGAKFASVAKYHNRSTMGGPIPSYDYGNRQMESNTRTLLYIVTYGCAGHNESARGSISNFALAFKIRVNCIIIFFNLQLSEGRITFDRTFFIIILRNTIFLIIQKVITLETAFCTSIVDLIRYTLRHENFILLHYLCRLHYADSEFRKIFSMIMYEKYARFFTIRLTREKHQPRGKTAE